MKANKEFRNPRNEGNKTAKNEINEVLEEEEKEVAEEEEEENHDKSFYINRKELKDNSKKISRAKVVEYKMK